jgi:hypothetical protein
VQAGEGDARRGETLIEALPQSVLNRPVAADAGQSEVCSLQR